MKKKAQRGLGDLQVAIMHVLWERQAATLAEIRTVLERDRPIATTTIATVLSRLEQGGFVSHREGARVRVYVAKVPQSDLQRMQTRRLIDRLFGGRASQLVAHLVRESDFDDSELARLRKLMRQRERP